MNWIIWGIVILLAPLVYVFSLTVIFTLTQLAWGISVRLLVLAYKWAVRVQ